MVLTLRYSRNKVQPVPHEPVRVQWFWDASGFTARISKNDACAATSQDSAVGGNNWRELYRAAIVELDRELLQARVKAAEDAIHARAPLNLKSEVEGGFIETHGWILGSSREPRMQLRRSWDTVG